MIYKTFNATYSPTEAKYHENVEDELRQFLANEIQKEIDNQLMVTIMRGMIPRWTEVELDRNRSADKEWCRENLSMDYQCIGNHWFFQDEGDATLFIMTWC